MRIALTGSIGMGKSTVARMFEAAGVPVFDADAVVRTLQGPGGALVPRIGERFPQTVRGGVLNRERLASLVMEDPAPVSASSTYSFAGFERWKKSSTRQSSKRARSSSTPIAARQP